MKRLNAVVEVLTNPAERAHYDRRFVTIPPLSAPLLAPVSLPPPVPARRRPNWIWTLAILAALTPLVLVWNQNPSPIPPPISTAPDTPKRSVATKPRRTILAAPKHIAAAIPEPTPAAVNEPEPPRAHSRPADPPPPTISVTTPHYAPDALPAAPSDLTGEWLFVPSPANRRDDLYPPEYIEMRIARNSGEIRGRYRARYHITDRPISPNVYFEFAGPAGPDGGRLHWAGPGGASGDISLRLLPNGAVEVTWVANEIGRDLGLISGTATLIRRLE